jgi:hypothetical protein
MRLREQQKVRIWHEAALLLTWRSAVKGEAAVPRIHHPSVLMTLKLSFTTIAANNEVGGELTICGCVWMKLGSGHRRGDRSGAASCQGS